MAVIHNLSPSSVTISTYRISPIREKKEGMREERGGDEREGGREGKKG